MSLRFTLNNRARFAVTRTSWLVPIFPTSRTLSLSRTRKLHTLSHLFSPNSPSTKKKNLALPSPNSTKLLPRPIPSTSPVSAAPPPSMWTAPVTDWRFYFNPDVVSEIEYHGGGATVEDFLEMIIRAEPDSDDFPTFETYWSFLEKIFSPDIAEEQACMMYCGKDVDLEGLPPYWSGQTMGDMALVLLTHLMHHLSVDAEVNGGE